MQFKAIPKRKFFLLGGDTFIILFATLLGFLIRTGKALNFLDTYTGASLINLFVFPIIFYIFDLYDLQQNFKSIKSLSKIIASVLVGVILTSFLFYALPPYRFGRGIFLFEILIFTPFIYFWRVFFNRYFKAAVRPKRILLMGKDWTLETLYTILKRNPEYQVLGVVNGDPGSTGNPFPTTLPVYQIKDLEDLKRKGDIDGIVTELMEDKPQEVWQSLLRLKMSGLNIMGAVNLYQDITGKIPIHFANDKWFVHSAGYTLLTSGFAQRVKRLFDVGVSFLALIIAWPLMGLIALFIKLDSHGPVFFRQKRVGQNDQEFELIKFRTMVHNAEEVTGAVWAQKDDSRVTRVGKILRITRLDELPQLINVLKEEMSFIGSRPERPEFVRELKEKIPYYSLRHSIKPGITGWAQVNYPYGASIEDAIEKLQYDLFYIQNMSLLLEIRIFLKTIQVVLFGKGSR